VSDYSTIQYIQPYLQPNEKIIWSGQPGKGIRFQPSDMFLIPFSLMWGGFAIFWETQAFATNGPVFMRLWGIPFVLIGLYIMVGRFFRDAYVRSRQIYALTSKRLLVLKGKSLQSNSLRSLPQLTLTSMKDGTGTINFGPVYSGRSNNFGGWSPAGSANSFQFLENANEVYAKILDTQGTA
jgi:hypothetical protein